MKQNKQNTALLVMDIQVGILAMHPAAATVISKVAKAITHARDQQIPVIYVTVGFRPGSPEISMNNKGFSAIKERLASANMDEFTKVHPVIAPLDGEVTVIKRRVSAFTGSDLEVVLRACGITHLVLAGISTSGVVLSTLREAADKDYRITVLADCCADRNEEVHHVLTTKIFPNQAEVLETEEWCKI